MLFYLFRQSEGRYDFSLSTSCKTVINTRRESNIKAPIPFIYAPLKVKRVARTNREWFEFVFETMKRKNNEHRQFEKKKIVLKEHKRKKKQKKTGRLREWEGKRKTFRSIIRTYIFYILFHGPYQSMLCAYELTVDQCDTMHAVNSEASISHLHPYIDERLWTTHGTVLKEREKYKRKLTNFAFFFKYLIETNIHSLCMLQFMRRLFLDFFCRIQFGWNSILLLLWLKQRPYSCSTVFFHSPYS